MQLTRARDGGITEKQYLEVVYCKTASLIAAASETGAVLAGADPATRKAMFLYGRCVGMAFQLVDDILDFTGTQEELGKRPFQDLREGKVTLPLLHALREADAADRGLHGIPREGIHPARETVPAAAPRIAGAGGAGSALRLRRLPYFLTPFPQGIFQKTLD